MEYWEYNCLQQTLQGLPWRLQEDSVDSDDELSSWPEAPESVLSVVVLKYDVGRHISAIPCGVESNTYLWIGVRTLVSLRSNEKIPLTKKKNRTKTSF